jgi:hypothetical protein
VLQLKTIHKDTFELLKELSDEKSLEPFALAEGTALALGFAVGTQNIL